MVLPTGGNRQTVHDALPRGHVRTLGGNVKTYEPANGGGDLVAAMAGSQPGYARNG
jgi:hypothetical protein